jgi:hypothetical protein
MNPENVMIVDWASESAAELLSADGCKTDLEKPKDR